MDDQRPAHAVWDCALGKQIEVPYSDEEWAGHKARIVAAEEERAAAAAADAELRAAVEAHPDPVVKALARRAGVL